MLAIAVRHSLLAAAIVVVVACAAFLATRSAGLHVERGWPLDHISDQIGLVDSDEVLEMHLDQNIITVRFVRDGRIGTLTHTLPEEEQ